MLILLSTEPNRAKPTNYPQQNISQVALNTSLMAKLYNGAVVSVSPPSLVFLSLPVVVVSIDIRKENTKRYAERSHYFPIKLLHYLKGDPPEDENFSLSHLPLSTPDSARQQQQQQQRGEMGMDEESWHTEWVLAATALTQLNSGLFGHWNKSQVCSISSSERKKRVKYNSTKELKSEAFTELRLNATGERGYPPSIIDIVVDLMSYRM